MIGVWVNDEPIPSCPRLRHLSSVFPLLSLLPPQPNPLLAMRWRSPWQSREFPPTAPHGRPGAGPGRHHGDQHLRRLSRAAPSAATLTNHEACRWQWMAPSSPQTCAGRAQYVVTEADVEAGAFTLSVTYSAYSQRNDQGESRVIGTGSVTVPVSVSQDPRDPNDPVVSGTIEVVSDPPADGVYRLGQVVDYRLVATNHSRTDRSLLVSSSNLDNVSNCRWSVMKAGGSDQCLFASHTITAADLKAGSFTPSVTWAVTSRTGYQGGVLVAEPTLGEEIQVGGPSEFDQAGSFTSPDANPTLEAGVSEPVPRRSREKGLTTFVSPRSPWRLTVACSPPTTAVHLMAGPVAETPRTPTGSSNAAPPTTARPGSARPSLLKGTPMGAAASVSRTPPTWSTPRPGRSLTSTSRALTQASSPTTRPTPVAVTVGSTRPTDAR